MKALRCKQWVKRLSDYIDGTLDDSFCEHLERHLKDCAPCEAFIRNLRRTVSVFHLQGQAAPARSLRDRLRARLRARKKHK